MTTQIFLVVWIILGIVGTILSIADEYWHSEDEWNLPYICSKILQIICGPITFYRQVF